MHTIASAQEVIYNSIMESRLVLGLLAILSCFLPNQSRLIIPGLTQKAYIKSGDINVGIMTDAHSYLPRQYCDYTALQMDEVLDMEAVVWYADKINRDQMLLPNISLGFVALDTCRKSLTALARAVYFVPSHGDTCACDPARTKQVEPMHHNVVGVIGPMYSTQAIAISSFMALFEVPILSTYATSDELRDRNRFPYFMRLVPPDQYQSKAIVDVLQYMNWTYVSLVYSEGGYGENGARNVEQYTDAAGICIAFSHRIPSDAGQESFTTLLQELRSYHGARAVVLFMQPRHVTMLMKAVMDGGTPGEFIWVSSDNFVEREKQENPQAAQGSISIDHPKANLKEFADNSQFVTWRNNDNPWIRQFWEREFNCVWNSTDPQAIHCEQFENRAQSPNLSPFSWTRIVLGLYTYAHALDEMIRKECPTAFVDKTVLPSCLRGATLYQYMLNVSFESVIGRIAFSSSGDILGRYTFRSTTLQNGQAVDVVVGGWDSLTEKMYIDQSLVQWDHIKKYPHQHMTPDLTGPHLDSVCSYPCADNEFYFQLELPCCWECRTCRVNERMAGNRTTCETCPLLSWPGDDNPEVCVPITPTYLLFTDQLSIILLALAAVGILFSLTVQVIYFTHSKTRLIKASSIELSLIILFGTLIASIVVCFFISRPTTLSCFAREVGFHVSVSTINIPLMLKTTRIYRIFSASQNSTQAPKFVSRRAQTFMTCFLMIIQVFIITISELQAPSAMELRQPIPTLRYVEAACGRPLWGFLLPLSTNIAVVLVCAALGFLTRRLPENFNDSWFIFVSVSTTLFMWAVFLPTYFSAFYAYQQVALMALCLLFNVYVTLAVQFGPRVYALYYVQDDKIKFAPTTTAVDSTSVTATT